MEGISLSFLNIEDQFCRLFLSGQAFESTLKSWEDKRKIDSYRAARPRLNSQQSMEYLTEEECAQVQQLGIVADTLINKYAPLASSVFTVTSCVALIKQS